MKKWTKVDSNVFTKEEVHGAGPFVNERGVNSVEGNSLTRKWNSKARNFMTFFSFFWCTFIGYTILKTWNGPITVNETPYPSLQVALADNSFNYIFSLFPIFGIAMAYITLTMWLNRTTIEYRNQSLKITKGPLPWRGGNITLSRSDIRQCWVEQYTSHTMNDIPVYAFRVVASRMRGKPIVVDKGLRTYQDARILEQWLERKLDITDENVPQEYSA